MDNNNKIIQAIHKGNNSELLQLLYKNLLPKVIQMVISKNGTEDDAKDIFQDAVIVFMREYRYGKFDTSKPIEGYIFIISRNLWINTLKRNNKMVQTDDMSIYESIENEINTDYDIDEREQEIKGIFKHLGKMCMEILQAQIFEGLDYKEIAEKIGLASGDVVKTYKNRCKNKLLDLLAKHPKLRNELLKHEQRFRKYL
jgi:RNA polymerase sigma factor (sigma-70 family)